MDSELPGRIQGEQQPDPIVDEVAGMKERLSQMGSLIQQAASLAVTEARRADEIMEDFAATVAALEAQLQQKEKALKENGPAIGDQDEHLTPQIRDLESRLREKEELLEVRDAELRDLRAKVEEASVVATAEDRPAQEIQDSSEMSVAALKAELEEKEALLGQKDAALKEMEESLNGLEESLVNQIRILENQLEEMVQKSGPETPEPAKKEKTSRKSPKRS